MTPWRLIVDKAPLRGAANMAIDTALLQSAQKTGTPTLRFYQWTPACLSFGRNQITDGVYDVLRLRTSGIDVVRRPTGGLAVLHHRELTYSFTAPAVLLGGPRATYESINAALVAGLRAIGVDATLAGAPASAARPDTIDPCFHSPSAGEVVVGGAKLVGSAQRCESRTVLQHGSILLDGEQSSLVSYQTGSATGMVQDAGSAGVTLRSLLGTSPDVAYIIDELVKGFESALGIPLAPGTLLEAERERARELEVLYDSREWTWRR